MKYFIKSQEHPIGKVKDFIYRVEFKNSLSCHYPVTAYFFLDWKYTPGSDTCDVLVKYININTDIPDESDVELPIGQTTPNS